MIPGLPKPTHRKKGGTFRALAAAVALALIPAAFGCKDESPSPGPVAKKVVPVPKKTPPAPAQRAEPSAPAEAGGAPAEEQEGAGKPTVYRPRSERDPFKSFVTSKPQVTVRTEKKARILETPLQRYSLDQLKVVGIISGGGIRRALLEDDVGKGYVVSKGDAVGREGGKIIAIEKDRIVIENTYRDVLGNQKVRHVTKKLYASEEGENP